MQYESEKNNGDAKNSASAMPQVKRLLLFTYGILGIKCIEILLIKLFLRFSENIAKALKMDYLSLTQKLNYVIHVGII